MSVFWFKILTSVVANVLSVLEWQAPKILSLAIVDEFMILIFTPEFESVCVYLNRIISDLVGDTNILIVVNNKFSD